MFEPDAIHSIFDIYPAIPKAIRLGENQGDRRRVKAPCLSLEFLSGFSMPSPS